MRLEWSLLGLKSRCDARSLNLSRQGARGLNARRHAQPSYANQAPTLECSEVSQREVEPGKTGFGHSIGDVFDKGTLNRSDEAHRQVQIGRRHPPKLRSEGLAARDVRAERFAMFLGQRQPKERPDSRAQRAGFFQAFGAHVLGAVGRQP
jgi:hypothetical protein